MRGVPNKIPVTVSLPMDLLEGVSEYVDAFPQESRSGLTAKALRFYLDHHPLEGQK